MGTGLKNFTKNFNFRVGKNEININTNKEHANTILVIPLYESNYTDPVNLSLYFSLNDTELCTEFGNGMRLNYYKDFDVSNYSVITLNDCDFSQATFFLNNSLYKHVSNETTNYIDRYSPSTSLDYTDIHGNKSKFQFNEHFIMHNSGMYKYPYEVYSKKGNYNKYEITYNYNEDNYKTVIGSITGNSGEKAEFIKDDVTDLITRIDIYRLSSNGYNLYETIRLSYTNGYLTEITNVLKGNNNSTYTTIIDYNESLNYLSIKDNKTLEFIRLDLNNDKKVIKVTEGYDSSYENGRYFDINYISNYLTEITDYNNRTVKHHFRKTSTNKYVSVYDSDDTCISRYYKYDDVSLFLLYDSGNVINSLNIENNIIISGFGESTLDFNSETHLYIETVYDNVFNEEFYGNAYILNSSNTWMEQVINYSGKRRDQLVFSLWGKDKYEVPTNNIKAKAIVAFYNDGAYIQHEQIIFKDPLDNFTWNFESIPITMKESYNKIEVRLELIYTEITYLFSGLTLINKSYNSKYEYNDDLILEKKTTNGISTGFEYGDNYLVKYEYKDDSYLSYTYDNSHNLILQSSSKGLKKLFTYDDKNNVTDIKIETVNGSNKYILTKNVYNENENLSLNHEVIKETYNEEHRKLTYDYDLFTRRLNTITNEINTVNSYTYNDYDYIREVSINRGVNSETNEVIYNDKLLIDKQISPNNNTFKYVYENNLLKDIKIVNGDEEKNILSYTYKSITNNDKIIKTSNIASKIYGNGDKYLFNYDNHDNLTEILYRKANTNTDLSLYTYEYNMIDMLERKTDERENISTWSWNRRYRWFLNFIQGTNA